jgi:hypothetical protein
MIMPMMRVWEMVMRVNDRLVPVLVSMPSARRDAWIVFMLVVGPCGQDLPGREASCCSVRICDFVTGELHGSLLRKSTLMRRRPEVRWTVDFASRRHE